jgi:hypothetical protein
VYVNIIKTELIYILIIKDIPREVNHMSRNVNRGYLTSPLFNM